MPCRAPKMPRRDGVERKFKEVLGPIKPEGFAQVTCIQRLEKEDVEQLASDAPVSNTPRKRLPQLLGGIVEAVPEKPRGGDAKLL